MKRSHLVCTFLSILLSVYVVLRAVVVPFTIDEAITFLNYVHTGSWWPTHAKPDANNHLLNSFLAILSSSVFGNAPWALRLPNILAGVLYLVFAVKWCKRMHSWQAATAVFAALVGSHFLIDFFALCRGYGLSLAFLSVSLYYLLDWQKKNSIARLGLSLAAMVLAVFSNLALLIPSIALLSVALLLLVVNRVGQSPKRIAAEGVIVLLSVVPLVWLAKVAFGLQESGLIYIGGTAGFWNTTVVSVLQSAFGSLTQLHLIMPMVLAIPFVVFLLRMVHFKFHVFTSESTTLISVLAITVVGQLLAHHWFEVNYPVERVALYFIPLTVLAIGHLFDDEKRTAQRKLMYVPLVFLWLIPVGALPQINLSYVAQWKWNAGTEQYFQKLMEEQKQTERPILVRLDKLQQPTFQYYNTLNGMPLLPALTYASNANSFDYLISKPNTPLAPQGFDTLAIHPVAETVLYKRNQRLNRVPLLKQTKEPISGNDEYVSFFSGHVDTLASQTLLLEARATLSAPVDINAWVVMQVLNKEEQTALYTHFNAHEILHPNGEETYRLHIQAICPAEINQRDYVKFFLWNIDREPIALSELTISMHALN